MYDELLRVKKYQEQSAAGELLRAQRQVEKRGREKERMQSDLERYHARRLEEEGRLFEEIRGNRVGLKKIDEMRQQADLMHVREAQMESELAQAEKRLEEARQGLEAAEEQHKLAARELEKFKQLVAVQRESEERAAERREESEMEEAVEAMYHPHSGSG